MKYLRSCGLALVVTSFVGNAIPASIRGLRGHPAWRTLSCHGVTQRKIGLSDTTLKDEWSSDKMTIVRKGNSLVVTVNGAEAKKRFGREDFFSDTYVITREGQHGVAAVHSSSIDLVVHTLVVTSTGESALWSESGIFLLEPHQPFSSIVAFECIH